MITDTTESLHARTLKEFLLAAHRPPAEAPGRWTALVSVACFSVFGLYGYAFLEEGHRAAGSVFITLGIVGGLGNWLWAWHKAQVGAAHETAHLLDRYLKAWEGELAEIKPWLESGEVLTWLFTQPGVRASHLQAHFGMSPRAAARLLGILEQAEIVGPPDGEGQYMVRASVLASEAQNGQGSHGATGGDDPTYEPVLAWVSTLAAVTAVGIQRRFRTSYPHTSRLIDRLEREGWIGPCVNGKRPVYAHWKAGASGLQRDPWTVLGIPRTATPEETKTAYLSLVQQYHPDKVAHLGAELQTLAAEKTKAITQAYGAIRKQQGW
jgi:hypothetical protein